MSHTSTSAILRAGTVVSDLDRCSLRTPSLLHGRTRLAHHHVRCRQPHRKIGERLADKAAHALPASGAAGAPAATRAPAATGAHRSPQGATGANASLDPLEFWSVGRQPRLTASAISSGVAFVWIRTVRTDFTGGAIGATAEVTGRLARFRQINMQNAIIHHDALEFPDGRVVLLTRLCEGQ